MAGRVAAKSPVSIFEAFVTKKFEQRGAYHWTTVNLIVRENQPSVRRLCSSRGFSYQ